MADNESTTKVEDEKKDNAPEGEAEDVLSLDSLDEIIANEDPEFAKALGEIGPDDPLNAIYEEGVELEYTLEEEIKLWQRSTGLRQKVFKLLPFLPKISYRIKMKRTVLRLSWIKWKEQAIQNLKNAGPSFLAWSKKKAKGMQAGIGTGLAAFKQFSLVKKLAFVGLILVTGVSAFLIYRTVTKGLIPHEQELFIGSFSEWAQSKYHYDPKAEMESFYDSTRTAQNILLMKKMVVNLKRSSESGPNPMGAFEFYVEGTASEVVVEIKDREPEVEDLFLRTIEETTYDQAASGEGKQLLCERLRKEVNKILTKGYVRRIFIKTAIIKP
ncbi:MAG: flagellar protein required for flagellar formation [Bdellovibrio sp. ArHS]|uniref:flagellar basal body-associated FliL family protein n=1 Tax=Bdellovibrio sp. ArHS TaxID=1569284 RepID=UPI000582F188|nr:flagellar basal body-associated FliL family protein [Bdellovibrio sp. ArHS]KHD89878.1 MAG: flagellar protein required for flagellar formation [Bdellovibrio sp. ArHS]